MPETALARSIARHKPHVHRQLHDQTSITPRILTAPNRELSYRLRYEVYCLERGFLDPLCCPDGRESDEFDNYAVHLGAFAPDGTIVGSARLILPSNLGFSLSQHCALDYSLGDDVGEVSRLVIPRAAFRECSRQFSRSVSDIAIQLYRALYQTARACGLSYLIAAMEPSLERLLRRLHFPFKPIGPVSDYFGWVRPYLISLDDLEFALAKRAPGLLALFQMPFADDVPRRPRWLPQPVHSC